MARRKTLTDAAIASLPAKAKPYTMPDPEFPGHYIRVRPGGSKVFCAVTRAPSGKQVWHTIGASTLYTVAEAREKAREAIKAIKEGRDREGPETFETVAETWYKRHVEARGVISAQQIRASLDKYLLPAWRTRDFAGIRRADIAKLLDEVEEKVSAGVADFALGVFRIMANWYATRHDDYTSPVIKGMQRSQKVKRERILTDDELRAVWKAAEANGVYGAFVRVALLTGQRREKLAEMKWEDVSVDGEWKIPAEDREKSTAGSLVLPEVALQIIKAQPRFVSNPYVFAGNTGGHISGYGERKAAFDAKVKIADWRFHDLRRTARSLMSRAGVRPDIAERVLGHAIGGVAGVYDRHSYNEDKADALKRLAGLIELIVNPPAGNVVRLAV
jgi:integrase